MPPGVTTVRLLTLVALWILKKPAPEVAAVRRLSLARTPIHRRIDRSYGTRFGVPLS